MKIMMNVEDVALMVARPSQISLRLGALLDKNRRRRPVSRATKWLALLLTVAFIPLLAAARAASDSSPEKTVRAFVAALNAGHFEEAADYVNGSSPNADFNMLRQTWKSEKPSFSVSVLTSETKGDKALVKATLTIQSGKQPANRLTQTGNVTLVLVPRSARWLLVPMSMEEVKNASVNPKTSEVSLLTSIALMLQSPKAYETPREREQSESFNLKQLMLGVLQYAIDHDETFPPMQNMAQLKKAIFRYVKSEQVFRQPKTGAFYVPNAALSKKKMASMDTPNKAAAVYEAQVGSDGKRGVAFEDGHVERVTASEWTKLKEYSGIE